MQHPSSLPWSRNAAPAETGDIARDRLAEQLGLAGCCMTDDQGQRREFDPFREWQQRQYAILLRRNVSNPFDPEGRRARERRERLIAQLDTFRGKEAIARELHLISRVHVDEISTDAQALSVRLTLIPTPGLCNARRRNSWVMWGHLSEWDFSEDLRHWTLTHIGTLQFDAGLIAALVRSGQDHASQPYNVDDVHGWIRAHRRDELASRLGAGAATLFWENRPIAQLTEHDLVRYPSIRGRYTVLDFDPELRDALRRHALLMSVPSLRHLSRDGLFLAGWSVDAGGVRVRTPTPTVDLRGDYVIWSDHGRAEADTVVRTLAASDGPEQHEEKSSRPDCP